MAGPLKKGLFLRLPYKKAGPGFSAGSDSAPSNSLKPQIQNLVKIALFLQHYLTIVTKTLYFLRSDPGPVFSGGLDPVFIVVRVRSRAGQSQTGLQP